MNDNIPQQRYDAGQYQPGREHLPQSYGAPSWLQPGAQQWQQSYPGPQPAQQPEPRRRHPIARHFWRNFFRYFFFAVQAIFLIWLISGLASTDAGKGIAVGLIIGLWVAVDVILGIGRIVVLFGRRYSGAHR
jgi:hypothetical protein